jgi:DNA-binding SARP family transcriptional activator/tetratricopeptide (TPR) repeat protein
VTATRPRLRIELLGGFTVRLDDGAALALPARKAQALLAYLAMPPGRGHSREKLTALLWGDTRDAQARQAFRQTLSRLRRAIANGVDPLVEDRPDALALQPDAVWVDVVEFEARIAAGTAADLERAAQLYVGDLLEGFAVDEPPFEEWLTVERERLRELALETLTRILAAEMRGDAAEPAIQTALRLLAIDPLQEAVHRALMRLHLRQGRRAAALRQYQACVATLQHELGAEPEEATRALYRQIIREHGGAVAPVMAPVEGAPIVGRSAESALLAQAFERSFETGGRVVTVSGEAGIGKTRLVQELVKHALARGCRVLSGACHETEQALPLRPWVDALRADASALVPGLVQRLTAGARAQLARVFPELATADQAAAVTGGEQGLLFEAMTELLVELASDGSMVIVLEDVHWADAASARLLAFLARRLGARPALVVATLRPEETLQAPVLDQALAELRAGGILEEIKLGPLGRADTLSLARGLHQRRTDPGFIDRIAPELWALSEGNPFVVVETVRALGEGSAGTAARRGLLPRTVHESIASRLARLSEPVRRAVAAAAVIGRAFVFVVLAQAAALEEPEAAAAIEELVRRRVLDAVGDKLDFCHDRIRRVAYDEIIPARRAQLHAAVARALGAAHAEGLDEITDQLGQHYLRAGEPRPALFHLKRFAEIAAQRYELEAALGALRLAADAVERLPAEERDRQRLDVALRQGFVMALGGRQRECLELLAARAELQQRVGDPALTSEYFFRLAMTHAYLGNNAESRQAGAVALAAAEQAGDDERMGKALYALAAAGYSQGASREALAHGDRAVPLLDHPGRRHWLGLIYWNQAANRTFLGELDAALETVRRCASVAENLGDRRLQSLSGFVESWVYAARGDDELAITCAQRALEISRDPIAANTSLQALGHAFLHMGDAKRAVATLEDTVERLKASPVRLSQVRSRAILAEAYLLDGDVKRAAQTAREAVEAGQAAGNLFALALAERASGRIARAAGDAAGAEAFFARALADFDTFGAAFEAAITRLDLARTLAARGERTVARAHIATAIQALTDAGAPRRVGEARDLARALRLA